MKPCSVTDVAIFDIYFLQDQKQYRENGLFVRAVGAIETIGLNVA